MSRTDCFFSFSQLKRYENSYRLFTGQQEGNDYTPRTSMIKNDRRDSKRFNLYQPLNENEFLSKTELEIRQEFRKMPNPPAKDTHAAK